MVQTLIKINYSKILVVGPLAVVVEVSLAQLALLLLDALARLPGTVVGQHLVLVGLSGLLHADILLLLAQSVLIAPPTLPPLVDLHHPAEEGFLLLHTRALARQLPDEHSVCEIYAQSHEPTPRSEHGRLLLCQNHHERAQHRGQVPSGCLGDHGHALLPQSHGEVGHLPLPQCGLSRAQGLQVHLIARHVLDELLHAAAHPEATEEEGRRHLEHLLVLHLLVLHLLERLTIQVHRQCLQRVVDHQLFRVAHVHHQRHHREHRQRHEQQRLPQVDHRRVHQGARRHKDSE